MNRWINRIALVTGANSGIGEGISKALVKNGMKVIGADLEIGNMQKNCDDLQKERGSLMPFMCDLTQDEQVRNLFIYIEENFGRIDVCVNNAGIVIATAILEGSPEIWRKQLDVNVVAMCYCSKLAVDLMKKKDVTDGQLINIASMTCVTYPPIKEIHFYRATKFAVKAATEGIRYELIEAKSKIRVAMITPGSVRTNILKKTNLMEHHTTEKTITADDVADAALYILSAPANVQVHDVSVAVSEEPY